MRLPAVGARMVVCRMACFSSAVIGSSLNTRVEHRAFMSSIVGFVALSSLE